jgi:hypothetical protein
MSFESDQVVTHFAFGLRYRSRLHWLPVPRLEEEGDVPFDVEVTFGPATPQLAPDEFTRPRFEAIQGRLWFRTRTIADFLVGEGRRVHVLPKLGAEPLKLCNLLFGGVSGALLIQRGILALHGCSVETPSGAALFCGDSGAGKSTLAALLLERGMRILDDNIAALEHDGDGFWVQPGLGHLRLTDDTLRLLGQSPRGPAFAAPYELKYLHGLESREFCDRPRPLRHIFLLDRSRETLWEELRGRKRLDVVQRHLFFRHMVEPLGHLKGHFEGCMALADSIPVSRIGYPQEMGLETWVDKIDKRIRHL